MKKYRTVILSEIALLLITVICFFMITLGSCALSKPNSSDDLSLQSQTSSINISSSYNEQLNSNNGGNSNLINSTNAENAKPSISEYNELKKEISEKIDKPNQISNIKNPHPFDKLKKYLLYHDNPLRSSRPPSLFDIKNEFGLGVVRQLNDDRIYMVYKTDNGGLFYFWFSPLGDELKYGTAFLINTAFIQKPLKTNNFSKIKVGDSISKVKKIDPVTSVFAEELDGYDEYYIPKHSRHLLSDGLLFIEYEKNPKGEYIVKNKKIYPNFEYSIDYGDTPIKVTYNYKIDPDDYVK